MIGLIGGVGFFEAMAEGADFKKIITPHGPVDILYQDKIAFIPRHGLHSEIPPHRINHRANIIAFKQKGILRIISVNSVGSLKVELTPPSIMVPHDYIGIWDTATFYDDKIVHIVPGLNEKLRENMLALTDKFDLDVIPKGVYIQTIGPRLETKSEVKMLANFADVVGMTMASEATLAAELKLQYASICSVDNYAHGMVDEPLTSEGIIKNARENGEKIRDFLFKCAGELQ
jgi:5'-methylthioadenosine phosphorylase